MGTRVGLDISEEKINPSTGFRILGLLALSLSRLPRGDRLEYNIKMDHKGAEYRSDLDSSGSKSLPVVACSENVDGFWGFEICGSPSGICGESSILKCNIMSLSEYFLDISEDRS